ncbi:MAG: ComEC/Rec2 family competence protein [Bacteroidales bacterium]
MRESATFMPLPRLFVPFGTGAAVYVYGGLVLPLPVFLLSLALLVVLWFIVVRKVIRGFAWRWLYGYWIGVFLFGLGYWMAQTHHEIHRKDHFLHHQDKDGFLLARLQAPVSERTNSFRAMVRVEHYGNDSLTIPVTGNLMLYLEKDTLAGELEYGDRMLIENRYSEVEPPGNPAAFNYKRYLSRQNTFHSSYISSGEWHFTGERAGFFVMRWALHLREAALSVFHEHHLSGREFAVVSALLLGYREYLDDNLRREFAGAGAMHILCVSGLHVGIIYMVLNTAFAFLGRMPCGMFLRTVFIILFIWLYAAITGFSPSVLRASVMFSFVSAGNSFRRPTNIYNTLAASAFVLVLTNPFIIAHIGFQLSYLAVISIVSLQPRLYNLFWVRNKILDKAWQIICVSLAAQLATGPLALYYFNQFPNYFLITNLAVIPLAGTIIYAGLFTLLVNAVPVLGMLAGQFLSLVVYVLHQSVRIIEGLPYSTSTGVFISLPETMLIFLLVISFSFFFIQQQRKALIVGLASLLLLVTSLVIRDVRNSFQQHFVVYQINRGTAVDFFQGKELTMLACQQVSGSARDQEFNMMANRLSRGMKQPSGSISLHDQETVYVSAALARKGPFVTFNGLRLLLLHDSLPFSSLQERKEDYNKSGSNDSLFDDQEDWPASVDYLIISQNVRLEPELIFRIIRPGMVIIDASNNYWNTQRWEEAAGEAGLDVWNVRRQGAYVSKNIPLPS